MSWALPISTKYAIRSLFRNSRRSALSIGGIAVGCSIALINISMTRGKIDLFIRNVAEGGVGHMRIAPDGWMVSHDSTLRLKNWKEELAQARGAPGVRIATPRARVQAMLAMGTHVAGVEIVGVDPETEPGTLRYVRTMTSGRYLKPKDSHAMVIGQAIADRLHVDIGDPVVVTAVDRAGNIKNEMFDVTGIVNLGSKQLESSICQVNLPDLESLSGLAGAGEISIVLDQADTLEPILAKLKAGLPQGDVALSWMEIRPDSRLAIEINAGMAKVMTFILIFVAFVGVASAQLTAILERQKEFAVLSAIGVGARRLMGLVLSEALVMGTLSTIGTMLLSGPLLSHLARVGFRVLSKSQSMSVAGTVVDPIFHPHFGNWFFLYAACLAYFSTLAASIYPAIYTVRLQPADALRVAQ